MTTNLRHLARRMKRKVGDLTLPNLQNYVEDMGWSVVYFEPDDALIESLHLQYYIKQHPHSFVFCSNDIHVIGIAKSLPYHDRLITLLHELGHVVCGHVQDGVLSPSVVQEDAANEFSWRVRAKPVYLHIARIVVAALAVIVSIYMVLDCTVFAVSSGNANMEPYSYASSPAPNIDADTQVIVTRAGEKYHLPGCRYVVGKIDTVKMAASEAEIRGLDPCKICIDK